MQRSDHRSIPFSSFLRRSREPNEEEEDSNYNHTNEEEESFYLPSGIPGLTDIDVGVDPQQEAEEYLSPVFSSPSFTSNYNSGEPKNNLLSNSDKNHQNNSNYPNNSPISNKRVVSLPSIFDSNWSISSSPPIVAAGASESSSSSISTSPSLSNYIWSSSNRYVSPENYSSYSYGNNLTPFVAEKATGFDLGQRIEGAEGFIQR